MTEQNLVSDLTEWLLVRGFSVSEEHQAEGFEDIWLRFIGEGCEVHLIRERGDWRRG